MSGCKTCKWLEVRPESLGRIVVRKDQVYPCRCPDPDQSKFPECITAAFNFRWPPLRAMVCPGMGKTVLPTRSGW